MPHTTVPHPGAPASVVRRGAANVSRITTRVDDHEATPWRVGVVVDLARAEPADVGTAVDLAQPDSISCEGARSRAAGHSPPSERPRRAPASAVMALGHPADERVRTTDLPIPGEEPRR